MIPTVDAYRDEKQTHVSSANLTRVIDETSDVIFFVICCFGL